MTRLLAVAALLFCLLGAAMCGGEGREPNRPTAEPLLPAMNNQRAQQLTVLGIGNIVHCARLQLVFRYA